MIPQGDPTNLDHVCVSVWGKDICAEWAVEQRAPPTFVDMLAKNVRAHRSTLLGKPMCDLICFCAVLSTYQGVNISLFGKL